MDDVDAVVDANDGVDVGVEAIVDDGEAGTGVEVADATTGVDDGVDVDAVDDGVEVVDPNGEVDAGSVDEATIDDEVGVVAETDDVNVGVDDAVGIVDDGDVSTDGKSGISISESILSILFCLSNSFSIAVFDLSSFLLNSANSAFKFSISFRTNSCGVGVVVEATGLEDEVGVIVEDVDATAGVDDGVDVEVDDDGVDGADVETTGLEDEVGVDVEADDGVAADVDVDGNGAVDEVGASLAAV